MRSTMTLSHMCFYAVCVRCAGAQASPLQCVPLADSCLALGAASCRAAVEALHAAAAGGELGDAGRDARVVYGQTDSLCAAL